MINIKDKIEYYRTEIDHLQKVYYKLKQNEMYDI